MNTTVDISSVLCTVRSINFHLNSFRLVASMLCSLYVMINWLLFIHC